MRRLSLLLVLGTCLAAPSWVAAQDTGTYNHAEVGVFADYLRFGAVDPAANMVGLGGRVGFNVHPNVLLEAEMSYDFERSFVNTNGTGGSGTVVRTSFRPLTALFGPKFQVGTSGPVRAFVTAKVGFVNFSVSNASVGTGFNNAFNNIGNGATKFAAYPGGGIEGFWGPFGLRLEAGDEIYISNGTFNNLKVSFGPAFRF
jgi:hypothetical protein